MCARGGILQLLVLGVVVGASAKQGEMMIIPDLGRRLALGDLYDARTDLAVGGSLWTKEVVGNRTDVKPARSSTFEFVHGDTLTHKTKLLDLGLDLALSFMGGNVTVDGSAKYLNDKKTRTQAVRMSLMHNMRTVKETVDPFHDSMMSAMNAMAFTHATHVVTGVTWGANTIATFEADFSTEEEKEQVEVFLGLHLLLNESDIGLNVSVDIDNTYTAISNRTKVFIAGDVLPPVDREMPTKTDETLKFMRQMHQFALGSNGKGVGMTLELTPLSWLNDQANQLMITISADTVERAIAVYESLDRSEEAILDLTRMDEGPFRVWKEDVRAYHRRFVGYRVRFAQELAKAVQERRNGLVSTEAVSAVLEGYWNSSFGDLAVAQAVEEKRDTLLNLQALVAQMRRVGVTMAESYSDFAGPTFNSLYDKVYGLVLVGMIPSSDRGALARVREFTALAEARMTKVGGRGVRHCLERQPEGAESPVCVENLKFVAIHFDSFCEEFCPARFCAPAEGAAACPMTKDCGTDAAVAERLGCWVREERCNATDPEQQYTEAQPLAECWCACPRTQVVEYASSRAGVRADHLPVKPGKPTVVRVDGAEEEEEHPLEQRVTVQLDEADDLGTVRNFRVRVLWHEAREKEGVGAGLEWVQRERVVETRDSRRSILIRGLAAGERYRFEVAGVNGVGEGPYSDGFPTGEDLLVAHNRPMITPRVGVVTTRHAEPPLNELPGWRTVRGTGRLPVTVRLSTPAREVVTGMKLDGAGWAAECEGVGKRTVEGLECTVPMSGWSGTAVAYVRGLSGDVVAWGNVTVVAPTERSCLEWEDARPLLCDTEIERVDGADDFETDPMHQVVELVLNGSTHSRDLLRYRVRVSWKEAGKEQEQQRVFDTLTDHRTISVSELRAGQTYRFQVAAVGINEVVEPYGSRFPKAGLKVGEITPVVRPVYETGHAAVPVNHAPGWMYNSTGKLRVRVGLSVAAEEPIAQVVFREGGAVVVECANYGESGTTGVTCTLPVGKFAKAGEHTVEALGVNGVVLGSGRFVVEGPGQEACYAWEAVKKKHCTIPQHSVSSCVEQCGECRYNKVTTQEYAGTCHTNACHGTKVWCPESKACFEMSVVAADKGCSDVCAGDSVYHADRNLCAVPCELDNGETVAPGERRVLGCAPGHVLRGGQLGTGFMCPADNTQRDENPAGGSQASWKPDRSQLPTCDKCENAKHCNGHATQVVTNADRSQCVCSCKTGYTGDTCGGCAGGYVGYPSCWQCTLSYCNNHAHSVRANDGQTGCVCSCRSGFEGTRCERCSPGYIGYPSCRQCSITTDCSSNTASVAPVGSTSCRCTCKTGFTGSRCESCASGYAGPQCIWCNVASSCNGRASKVTVTNSGQTCGCVCNTGYTGSTCGECASGYGPGFPSCLDTWQQPGTSCTRGTVTNRYWESRTCTDYTSCTTTAGWSTSAPTCYYYVGTGIIRDDRFDTIDPRIHALAIREGTERVLCSAYRVLTVQCT